MTPLAIGIDGLWGSRGRREVLHVLPFAVGRGSVTGLLGPNGSNLTVAENLHYFAAVLGAATPRAKPTEPDRR